MTDWKMVLCWSGIVLVMYLFSCKPTPLPVDIKDPPDFLLQGSMQNDSFHLAAGRDHYYMYTGYELDQNDIFTFWGELRTLDCPNCPAAFRLEIRDQMVRNDAEFPSRESFFREGDYPLAFKNANLDEFFRVFFTSLPADSNDYQFEWSLGDGTLSNELDPIHDYHLPEGEMVEVCLEATGAAGCSSSLCNEIILSTFGCRADYSVYRIGMEPFVNFQDRSQGFPPFTYRWDFGDGYGASLGNPGYLYQEVDRYLTCLHIEDVTGCESSFCQFISLDSAHCYANFDYSLEKINVPDTLLLDQVSLQWIDASGKAFRSDHFSQPPESFFRLVAIEPYRNNELDEATVRLKLEAEVTLFTPEAANSLRLTLSDSYLAVAVPQ